MDHSGMQDASC